MSRIAAAVVLAGLLLIPPALDSYQVYLLSLTLVWSLLALSMGLLVGFVGEINFGQAGFVGIAAYVSSLLRIDFGISFWLAAPVALAAVVLVAALIGVITLRLRGPFFVLVTLAFGEIVRIVLANWQDVTNGPIGLRGIAPPEGLFGIDFAGKLAFYYLALVVTVATSVALAVIVRSRTGRLLVALREDELLAAFVGVAVMRQKVIGLCISAVVAGLGGVLIGPLLSVISPGQFTIFASVDMLVMVIVGGVGTLSGPLIGAVFLVYVPEVVQFAHEYRPVLMGALLILATMFLPGGLVGLMRAMVARGGVRPSVGAGGVRGG